ncbi:hypothetical protein SSX86_013295 [Deinandra increscens subsp. villosa]|uniref:Uncharacterized protein n=1 Tax=Deinandra increscens subsp. villosa TaxID=3103831 RepID=A0AAP0H1N2_9ASTR
MAIGELILGEFISRLFEKVVSGDLISLVQSAGISSELNKLRTNLAPIRAVLVDAGEKRIKDTSVQLWLNKLQHLAYEIDDILDDLAYEAMRIQLDQDSNASTSSNMSKVLKLIPSKVHALSYGRTMSSKLDEITTKLGELIEEKNLLGLNDNIGDARSNRSNKRKRLEETSLVDVSKIIGREGDKEALFGKLVGIESSGNQNVNVMSIVGLGGIGKTTLAQLLYNDDKVIKHFELRSWVCVSDEFDVFTISKAIFKDVGGDDRKFDTLNQLQVALSEKLSKKKFLLVLDDVWSESYNEWELLQRPFNVGSHGSKVLVTTRKNMVASVMDSVQAYPLELLSNVDALSLFAQNASGGQNRDVNRILELHGDDIIKKCGRLPLALRTLGRVCRTKSNVEEWEELLNSEIWNSHNQSEIIPALKLSYYDLPPHLKQMFVYCCLFPKDYMFDKDGLVLLWMAEGFLYESNGSKSMESFGRVCFEELASRSFFLQVTNGKSLYTMHDLIHDLATSIAGEFFLKLDGKMDVDHMIEASDKCHHFSFIRDKYGANKMFKALKFGKHPRTFLAIPVTDLESWNSFFNSNIELVEVLPQLQFLRALSLSNYNIREVPPSIGTLKHLRYLNFSHTRITCLPEQLGYLHNLQSLLLSCCYELSSLPNSFVKLINLRHLDISHTQKLSKSLLGIVGLTGLQNLSKIVIGESDEFSVSDLKGLSHLQGQLSIKGLDKVINVVQAKEVKLQKKRKISDLSMEWSDIFDDSRNKATEYEVLVELRPFKKLRGLMISYYAGTEFPSWVGDLSFDFLTQLTLRGCRSCTSLPALGHLPSLKELFVGSMDGLERLEFLGHFHSCDVVAFPSLEVLTFLDMQNWKEWSTSGGDIVGTFPCLREITMRDCPKLDVVAIGLIPSLQVLHVISCSLMVLRSMVCVSPSTVRLTMDDIRGLTDQLCGEVLEHLNAVEYLDISKCNGLTYLWGSEAATQSIPDDGYGFLPFFCLRKLEIWECENLKSFPCEHLPSLESLEEMKIMDCPSLDCSFPCGLWPPNLRSLEIGVLKKPVSEWAMQNFPTSLVTLYLHGGENSRVVSFAKAEEDTAASTSSFLLPSSLTSLCIYELMELESLSEGLQHLTCLQHLSIDKCHHLRDLPHTILPSLSFFRLRDCSPELRQKCSTSGEFISMLFGKVASGDLISLAQSAGIHSELNKLRTNLGPIRAVLVDAGEKRIRDTFVQLWLNKLQHLAYEIDEILDDLAYETMRLRLGQESNASTSNMSKAMKFIPSKVHALNYGRKMSSKIDGITTNLRKLIEEKNLLGLNDNSGGERSNRSKKRKQLEETSLVDGSKIIGREGDKEALLGKLLGIESSRSPGSKILVTTRKDMVASVMDSVQAYPLELLSNEDALSLFAQNASGEQNLHVNRILELHGEDIIKKCGRLPLALRTLGRVFRTKSNVEEWEELLNSEIWNSHNQS